MPSTCPFRLQEAEENLRDQHRSGTYRDAAARSSRRCGRSRRRGGYRGDSRRNLRHFLHWKVNTYTAILRPLLFRLDAERAHHLLLRQLSIFPPPLLRLIFGGPSSVLDRRDVFGVDFPTRVGLPPGWTRTPLRCRAGKRSASALWKSEPSRRARSRAIRGPDFFAIPNKAHLINRMGFNNDGADAVAARLDRPAQERQMANDPGGNQSGKVEGPHRLTEAPADYLHSFRTLRSFGDYFVINVSSPNTPGLRDLQETHRLREIIRTLRRKMRTHACSSKLLRISPTSRPSRSRPCAEHEGLAGLIATNTTLDHSALPPGRDQPGGLSGKPLRRGSTHLIKILNSRNVAPAHRLRWRHGCRLGQGEV